MKSIKVIDILKTFDDSEWRACNKFFKNQSGKITREHKLYNFFEKTIKYEKGEVLAPDRIRDKTMPDLKMSAFQSVCHRLAKMIEEFMVINDILKKKNQFVFNQRLAQVYLEKGLLNQHTRLLNENLHIFHQRKSVGFFDSFFLLKTHHDFYFFDPFSPGNKSVENLITARKHLNNFYDELQSAYDVEFHLRKKLTNLKPDHTDTKSQTPLSDILGLQNKLIKEGQHSTYNSLKELLLNYTEQYNEDINKASLVILVNYCINQLKREEDYTAFTTELAELYLFGLESKILLSHGKMTENTFMNIIDALSKSKLELDPIEFINKWIHFVNTPEIENLVHLGLAMWYLAKDQSTLALSHISATNLSRNRILLQVRIKWITLACLCEDKEYLNKKDIITSNKYFFDKNKESFSKTTYHASLNFIKIADMLWHKKASSQIKEFVNNCDFLVMKYWIHKELTKMA